MSKAKKDTADFLDSLGWELVSADPGGNVDEDESRTAHDRLKSGQAIRVRQPNFSARKRGSTAEVGGYTSFDALLNAVNEWEAHQPTGAA